MSGCCRWVPWALALLVVSGCAGIPSSDARTALAGHIAAGAGMQPVVEASGGLPLHGFARLACQGDALHVFIEGDGLAWLDINTPSPDPTPIDPVGLKLAASDRACNVLYLGRPGQYAEGAVDSRYWRGARFAPEVVDSYVNVLEQQAARLHAARIRLTGYSGGGALAALVAARLHADGLSVELVTVAGNLDPVTWAQRRRLSPLVGSLNPADVAASLSTVPQVHLTGRSDKQVPEWVLDAFLSRMSSRECVRVVEVETGHAGPWEAAWGAAMSEPPSCSLSQHSPH